MTYVYACESVLVEQIVCRSNCMLSTILVVDMRLFDSSYTISKLYIKILIIDLNWTIEI